MHQKLSVRLIAEVGSVHDGSLGNARNLIDAAADCGADAVKFQTHIARAESLADAPSPGFFAEEPRVPYFERTGFTARQWRALKDRADARGILFLSSAFSLEAIDLLEEINVAAHKVPSGEVTNLPLLHRLRDIGKPVYLSSGMSSWTELDSAVEALAGGCPVTVMQCTSMYPCSQERVGLNVIAEIRERYALPMGFSDHTLGGAAAVAAVALGATVVEKHFTLSRRMYGSDASHSMEPDEFRRLADDLHAVCVMLANRVDKDDLMPYTEMKHVFEKSVVTAGPIAAGATLTLSDLAFKKPGDGISAARYEELIGATVVRDLPADYQIGLGDLSCTAALGAR